VRVCAGSILLILMITGPVVGQPLPLDKTQPATDAGRAQDKSSAAQLGHYETLRRARDNPPKQQDDYRKLERCSLAGTCQ
jgi:hypothetical protein